MMDHSDTEHLLDLIDSSFLEHKDSAINSGHTSNSMSSFSMDNVVSLPTLSMPGGSPLLTGASVASYSFMTHDDLSPSSPLTDASNHSDHDPLSPQSQHPFTEALAGQGNLMFLPSAPATTTAVSSSSSPSLSSSSITATSSTAASSGTRKRKTSSTTPTPTSTATNSRSKGRRTDSKKEAATASSSSSTKSTSRAAAKKAATKTAQSVGRSTRSGTRAAVRRDEDKTAVSPTNTDTASSSEMTNNSSNNGSTLPTLEVVPDSTTSATSIGNIASGAMSMENLLTAPSHMMMMGAVTLPQPDYERMLAEEERTKEKKLRKAEQARISRQKKKDRMAQLEETVALYKQQIAALQQIRPTTTAAAATSIPPVVAPSSSVPSSTSSIATNNNNVPTPATTAERKNSISPAWPRSPAETTSSNDDARSISQSSNSDESTSTPSRTTVVPAATAAVVATPTPAVVATPASSSASPPSSSGSLPVLTSLPPPSAEDEVNGEAVQRCIQSIITASYPVRDTPSTNVSWGLMAAAAPHHTHSSAVSSSSGDSKDESTASEALNNRIQSLFDVFAKRSKVTESHLDSLDKLLVPSMPLRFLEWALTQNDKFYSDPSGLWHCLWSKTLSLTPEQMAALAALRSEVAAQRAAEAEIRIQALNMTGIVIGPSSASSAPATTTAATAAPTATNNNTTSNDGISSSSSLPVTAVAPQSLNLSSTLSLQAAYSQLSALSRLHVSAANRWLRTLATILTPLQLARYFEWVNIYGHICVQINV